MGRLHETLLSWPLATQIGVAAAVGLVAIGAVSGRWWHLKAQTYAASSESRQWQKVLESLTNAQSEQTAPQSPSIDLRQWPPRQGIDELVKASADAASLDNAVALKRLAISHVPTSEQQAGHVQVEVEASGDYAALKGWQAELQIRLPSATVQQMRLQSAQAGGVQPLSAQWTWKLWVRDEGIESLPSTAAAGPLLRPDLSVAARDPFGASSPPRAPPAVVYVPPPAPSPPPAPYVPPLQWVTEGRMRGPDGRHWLVGHWGDQISVTLTEGGRSPRGHRVERITPEALDLFNPDTQERQRIVLPPPPRFETR